MKNKEQLDYERFGDLTFDDFRQMAQNPELSIYEKIGFPNTYRSGKEEAIFQDILSKLPLLKQNNKTILDIGAGCSELPLKLIELCKKQKHQLILIDSQEMLDHLPNDSFITKIPGYFPRTSKDFIRSHQGVVDVILSYSVLHYIFAEMNIFEFLDDSLSLLNTSGQMLLGDIPNTSKRKRFLSSASGLKHHQHFYDEHSVPKIEHFIIESQKIDDSVVLGLQMRARNAGFDAYLVPQSSDLPMANRREDLLIIKP